MTRIWIEFDDLDALKENLARTLWNRTHESNMFLLAKIGYCLERGMNDKQILEEIKDSCKSSFKDWNGVMNIKPFEETTKEYRDHCYSWADTIINVIKQKGDVR